MRFFLDTEFIERGPTFPVSLISIGMVSDDGREFYAISSEFDPDTASDWVRENVFPHLGRGQMCRLDQMATRIREFIGDEKPEFWGYYADYDWVVFAQIFGTMMDLPKGWPMYCHDLKQWCDKLGNPKLPKQTSTEHNALQDAVWNMAVHSFLAEYEALNAPAH